MEDNVYELAKLPRRGSTERPSAGRGPALALVQRRKDRSTRSTALLSSRVARVAAPDVSPPNLPKDESIPFLQSKRLTTPCSVDARQQSGLRRGSGSTRRRDHLEKPGSFAQSLVAAHQDRIDVAMHLTFEDTSLRAIHQPGEPGILTLAQLARTSARLRVQATESSDEILPPNAALSVGLTSGPVHIEDVDASQLPSRRLNILRLAPGKPQGEFFCWSCPSGSNYRSRSCLRSGSAFRWCRCDTTAVKAAEALTASSGNNPPPFPCGDACTWSAPCKSQEGMILCGLCYVQHALAHLEKPCSVRHATPEYSHPRVYVRGESDPATASSFDSLLAAAREGVPRLGSIVTRLLHKMSGAKRNLSDDARRAIQVKLNDGSIVTPVDMILFLSTISESALAAVCVYKAETDLQALTRARVFCYDQDNDFAANYDPSKMQADIASIATFTSVFLTALVNQRGQQRDHLVQDDDDCEGEDDDDANYEQGVGDVGEAVSAFFGRHGGSARGVLQVFSILMGTRSSLNNRLQVCTGLACYQHGLSESVWSLLQTMLTLPCKTTVLSALDKLIARNREAFSNRLMAVNETGQRICSLFTIGDNLDFTIGNKVYHLMSTLFGLSPGPGSQVFQDMCTFVAGFKRPALELCPSSLVHLAARDSATLDKAFFELLLDTLRRSPSSNFHLALSDETMFVPKVAGFLEFYADQRFIAADFCEADEKKTSEMFRYLRYVLAQATLLDPSLGAEYTRRRPDGPDFPVITQERRAERNAKIAANLAPPMAAHVVEEPEVEVLESVKDRPLMGDVGDQLTYARSKTVISAQATQIRDKMSHLEPTPGLLHYDMALVQAIYKISNTVPQRTDPATFAAFILRCDGGGLLACKAATKFRQMQGYIRSYLTPLTLALVLHFNPDLSLRDETVTDSITLKPDLRTAADIASDLHRANGSARRLKELAGDSNKAIFHRALEICWAQASRLADLGMADLRWAEVQSAFELIVNPTPPAAQPLQAAREVARRFIQMTELRQQATSAEEHFCWMLNLMLLEESVAKAMRTGAHDVFRASNIVAQTVFQLTNKTNYTQLSRAETIRTTFLGADDSKATHIFSLFSGSDTSEGLLGSDECIENYHGQVKPLVKRKYLYPQLLRRGMPSGIQRHAQAAMLRPEIDRLMFPKTSSANNSSDVRFRADSHGPLILARLSDPEPAPRLMHWEQCMMTPALERSLSKTIERESSSQANRDANQRP